MKTFATIAMLYAGLVFTAPVQAAEGLNIQVIIDNGVGLQEPGKFRPVMDGLLSALYGAGANRKFRDGRVEIITTASADKYGTAQTVWSGTVLELNRRYGEIQESVSHIPAACTDLERAFNEAKRNIARSTADRIWVFSLSSLIHTGRPCQDVKISLPQPVPPKVNLGALVADDRVERLVFLYAEADQRNVWFDVLEGAGAPLRAREGNLDFTVLNTAETYGWLRSANLKREMKK